MISFLSLLGEPFMTRWVGRLLPRHCLSIWPQSLNLPFGLSHIVRSSSSCHWVLTEILFVSKYCVCQVIITRVTILCQTINIINEICFQTNSHREEYVRELQVPNIWLRLHISHIFPYFAYYLYCEKQEVSLSRVFWYIRSTCQCQ